MNRSEIVVELDKIKANTKLDISVSERCLLDTIDSIDFEQEPHSLTLIGNQLVIHWSGKIGDNPGIISWFLKRPGQISEMVTEILGEEVAYTKLYLINDGGKTMIWQGNAAEFYTNFFKVNNILKGFKINGT